MPSKFRRVFLESGKNLKVSKQKVAAAEDQSFVRVEKAPRLLVFGGSTKAMFWQAIVSF